MVLYAQNLHLHSRESSQWAETLERWNAVLALSQRYTLVAATGADYAVIRLSVAHAAYMLGDYNNSHEDFNLAADILSNRCHFRRRGMGKYWADFIGSEVYAIYQMEVPLIMRNSKRGEETGLVTTQSRHRKPCLHSLVSI